MSLATTVGQLRQTCRDFPQLCEVHTETSLFLGTLWLPTMKQNQARSSAPPSECLRDRGFLHFIAQQGPATKPGQASPVLHPGAGARAPLSWVVTNSPPHKPTGIRTKQVTSLKSSCPCALNTELSRVLCASYFFPQETGQRTYFSHPTLYLYSHRERVMPVTPLQNASSSSHSKILLSPGNCSPRHMRERSLQRHPWYKQHNPDAIH